MKKLALMLLLVASSTTLFAQTSVPKVVVNDKDGWHKIGETTVSFDKDTDKIPIVGANRFAAIKIKVTEAPINLKSFDVAYGDNQVKNVAIGKEIKSEGETSIAQLGGEKVVKRVDLHYNTVAHGNNKKAHVEVWGLKTNPDKK
ncbi:hypothetical protein [Flavobacterium sp.]|uniref:hypothetical protein n=1 Tax=Flavobacterium sp. TaxID=239 RepID=UPI002BC8422F|nr:hypothetical protein [Flavobacterium sp.]HSD06901.1 hypothetical protein [Flavobacterium sp.]